VQTLHVDVGHSRYPISIGSGLLANRELLDTRIRGRDLLIVTNTTVARLYLAALTDGLTGKRVADCILPDGEQHKTLQAAGWVLDALIAAKMNRDATVLALGGGVVGDIAGFAAACYQRGVGYVQIPTTLLAQVDSSVGGKTGVNHPGGKNLIGAFYQPLAVIADTDTLATLPDRELRAGLAEVIKYGCVWDPLLFDWLDHNMAKLLARDMDALTYAIARSCEIKATVVARDEREQNLRKELAELESNREELAAAVDPAARARYERLVRSKGENVVVGVQHGVCGGCHMKLPAQILVSCQQQQEIVSCTNCGRILYYSRDMALAGTE